MENRRKESLGSGSNCNTATTLICRSWDTRACLLEYRSMQNECKSFGNGKAYGLQRATRWPDCRYPRGRGSAYLRSRICLASNVHPCKRACFWLLRLNTCLERATCADPAVASGEFRSTAFAFPAATRLFACFLEQRLKQRDLYYFPCRSPLLHSF